MNLKLFIPALLVSAVVVLGTVYFFNNTNIIPTSEVVKSKLDAQEKVNETLPEDRVYAHLDKTFYAPGEAIWFSAYVRNATDLSPSEKSEVLRAELINPKGEVEMEYKVPVINGIAQGDFQLPQNILGGQYMFQAYTMWQTNDENPAIFKKEIQIQKVVLPPLRMDLDFVRDGYASGDKVHAQLNLKTLGGDKIPNKDFKYTLKVEGNAVKTLSARTDALGTSDFMFTLPKNLESKDVLVNVIVNYNGTSESISKSVPVVLSDLELKFFPEGGDMVNGLTSKVAFKSNDSDGEPIDISGVILDSKGNEVTSFSSEQMGLGAFKLLPESGESYQAKILFPSHIQKTYELPRAQKGGFTLAVKEINDDEATLSIGATQSGEVSIIASVRGESKFTKGIKVKKGKNELVVPLKDFPIGLAQFTLFDGSGIARAERLAFVNTDEALSIEIKTDKEVYQPREKVNVQLLVTNKEGQAVETSMSMAVVDEQLLSFANDKSSNIYSWLLMEADIDADVKEPQRYFEETEEALIARDYLLMTSGWRRFGWKALTETDLPEFTTRAERMVLAGTVLDNDGNPIDRAKVQVVGANKTILSDKDGFFEIEDVDLTKEPVRVAISAQGHYRQEQLVGDYGNFDYQLFDRNLGQGIVKVDESANRATQATQLGIGVDITRDVVSHKVVASAFNKKMRIANFGKRYDEVNASDAGSFEPVDFEEGVDYQLNDHRVPTNTTENEDEEELEGAYLSDVAYYRFREFPVKEYKTTDIDKRTDFRSTTYWNGRIQTDKDGKAEVSFWNTDAVTSFRVTTEGMSNDGKVGRAEKNYKTELPFSIQAKIPVEVTVGDEFEIPVTLTNNTKKSVKGTISFEHPDNLELLSTEPKTSVSLKKKGQQVFSLKYKVKRGAQEGDLGTFAVGFKNDLFNDKIEEEITVVPQGFPTRIAYSGTGMDSKYEIDIRNIENKSLDVELQAFPSALSEVVHGMEGMMKEPYGCFEQTSSCNYPNVLALQYLRQTQQSNPTIERQSMDLLKKGYERLKGFESPNGGFDWFGSNTAHEGITAFAIMQFTHMKEVYPDVDEAIINRSINWLLDRRDGNGSFLRDERTTWSLGLTSKDENIFNAFIMYCLSEAKVKGLDSELKNVYESAKESDDAYLVGLAALAHYNYGKSKQYNELTNRQNQLVSVGTAVVSSDRRTAFGSTGANYDMEAKSLLIINLARLKDKPVDRIKELASQIRESRNWKGSFGPTQTTVLAMRALMAYNDVARQTNEDGTIAFYVNGKKVATKSYAKGQYDVIKMEGLEQYFGEGEFDFEVKFEGVKEPLPHTVIFKWNTILPPSDKERVFVLNTEINDKNVKVGDVVRLNVELENITKKTQATPMAIVGIPAGLTANIRQLNDLVEQGKMDYYELKNNNVILYFRHLKKGEKKDIGIDLKADFVGNFQAPASSAYSYYNDNAKDWVAGTQLSIAAR